MPCNFSLESIACRVKFGGTHLTICSVYCPPDTVTYDELCNLQDSLPCKKLIVGDFNAHHTLWGSLRVDRKGEQVAGIISDSNLVLLNDGSPTRIDDSTGNLSVLDLSLVSPAISGSCQWQTIDDSLGSDHFPIIIKFSSDTVMQPSAPKFNVKRADWKAFTRGVNIEIVGETIDDKVNSVKDSILQAATATIPKTSTISAKHRVPWWTPDCRRVLCERNRAYRLFKTHISDENFRKYKLARARARRTLRQAKRDSWRSFVSIINSETPLTQVWSTVNKLNKKKPSIRITNITHNNINYDNPRDIANALARQFSFASSSENYHPAFLPIKEASELQHIDFATGDELDYNCDLTMQELVQALGACSGTSPGPDEIRYEMIKHLDHGSMIKMLQVFNEIWKGQTFPNSWHFAHIIPIPKGGGEPRSTSSYRPIALTSCLCKVMERIVNRRLLHFLNSRNLLVDEQCGFRKGRQTLDQLTNLECHIQQAFAKKQFLIAVFLDIEKAYDMTWRHGLLRKLYAMGLRGNMPIFIKNFIADRTFSVKLFSETVTFSDNFVQANGVPQGSVLSPTLFLCMINDILPAPPRNLKYSLYADDCAIWHSSRVAEFSANRIQMALNRIHDWGLQWGFKFSVRKSVGVVFTHRRSPDLQLTMGPHPLPIQDSAKFLGLHFDSRLTWRNHVSQLKTKCLKALNLLKCITGTKWGADRKSLLMLYKALIRSRVDYGSIVYGSASESVLKGLDVVQNACLRVCLGALRCTRTERLEVESQVPPLRFRRDQLLLSYQAKKAREPSHPAGLRRVHPGGHGVRPLAEGPSRPPEIQRAPGGNGVRPPSRNPGDNTIGPREPNRPLEGQTANRVSNNISIPRESSQPPGGQLMPPGGHGDRPLEGPSHPGGRPSASGVQGAYRSLQARLHDLVQCVGIDYDTIDTLVIINIAPWATPPFDIIDSWLPAAKSQVPEVEVHQRFREIIVKHLQYFHLYTDGSKTDECVGASVWSTECQLRFRLPNHTSIFLAELFAIDKAIDFALSTTHDRIVIFTDSLSSLKAIKSLNTTNNEIQGNIISKLFSANKSIKLIWVPSHYGIYGNEQADKLAGSTDDLDLSIVRTDIRCFVSLIKTKIHLLWQRQWTRLDIRNKVKTVIEPWVTANCRSRRDEVVLARLRVNATRLTHLEPYINKSFPPICTTCNVVMSIPHILIFCSAFDGHRAQIKTYFQTQNLALTINNILSDDKKIIIKLMRFLRETKLYDLI